MTDERSPGEPPESSAAQTGGEPAAAGTPPAQPAGRQGEAQAQTPRTRTSMAFSGLVAGAVVLVLLLVFILENTQSVKISYFGASGHLSLGVALLLAAVGGALLAGLLGVARIAQLRRHERRRARSGRH